MSLSPLKYGTVKGRFIAAVADTTADIDDEPDAIPLTGKVTFRPDVQAILLGNGTEAPVTVMPAPITAQLDAQGYLTLNGKRGVKLIATDNIEANPTNFTYTVELDLRYQSTPVKYPGWSIQVPADQETDLTLQGRVPSASGTAIIRGASVTSITAANGVITFALSDSTSHQVSINGALVSSIDGKSGAVNLAETYAPKSLEGDVVNEVNGQKGVVTVGDMRAENIASSDSVERSALDAIYASRAEAQEAFAPAGILSDAVTSIDGKKGQVSLSGVYATLDPQGRQPVRKGEIVVNVADYGVVGNGIADDTAALQAAVAATPHGGTLIFPSGGVYRLTAAITGFNKTITIIGYGATLRAEGNIAALNWSGSYGTILPVTSMTPTTVTHAGEPVAATRLATTGTPDMVRGDVLKLVSDDVIPGARPGDGAKESRIGEFLTVDSVSGADVIVMGSPRENYVTNIRAAKINPIAVHVKGVTFETNAPAVVTWSLIGLTALVNPTFTDVAVKASGGPAIHLTGCCGYTIDRCTVSYADNNPSTGHYGYGVLDNACSYGRVTGLRARHVRHAFTDDTPRVAVNTSLNGYGRSYGGQVLNSVTVGSTGTAFSTHAASENMEFINCQAIDCLQGYGLRGRRHLVKNCFARGGGHGLFILTEEWGSDSWGHLVDGLVIENVSNIPVYINQNGNATPNPGLRELRTHRLRNIRISAFKGQFAGIRAHHATVELSNIKIVTPTELDAASRLLAFANCAVDAELISINTTATTTGSIEIFHTSGGTRMRVQGVTLVNSSTTAATESMLINGETDTVEITGGVYDHRPAVTISTHTAAADIIHDYITRLDGGYSSTTIMQASASFALALRATRQDFTAHIQGTAWQEMGPLLNGRRRGQVLRIVNLGSASLGIPNGATPKTQLVGSNTITLPSAGSVTLVWTGSVWQQGADSNLVRAPNGTRYRLGVNDAGAPVATAV